MNLFDAHFHLVPTVNSCGKESVLDFYSDNNFAVTCAHDEVEFIEQEKFILENNLSSKIIAAFGIHPQMPLLKNAAFLEKLLKEKRISMIGETGLDFFTEEFRSHEKTQVEAFNICIDLAIENQVPLVIHNRKALDLMFGEIRRLSKIPLVLFHSFAFSSREAESILNHKVNGYFSFSKQIINGNKKSISCIRDLPLDRIFLETDSPFQTLKGELHTLPCELAGVYKKAAEIRGLSQKCLESSVYDNFIRFFGFAF